MVRLTLVWSAVALLHLLSRFSPQRDIAMEKANETLMICHFSLIKGGTFLSVVIPRHRKSEHLLHGDQEGPCGPKD